MSRAGDENLQVTPLHPVELTQQLIRCPSVTPVEAGVLDLLQSRLAALGFDCRRVVFEEDDASKEEDEP